MYLNSNYLLKVARGVVHSTNEMVVTVTAVDYNLSTGSTIQNAFSADIVTNTNGITGVVVCGAPQASFIRKIQRIQVNNQDNIQDTIKVIENINGVDTVIQNPIPIVVNGSLCYEDGRGWFSLDGSGNVTGTVGNLAGDVTGPAGANLVGGINGTGMTLEGMTQRVYQSRLHCSNAALTNGASTIAYFNYLGKTVSSITPKYVEGFCVGVGSGVTSIEVGIFSSPNPPNKSSQTLTKITSQTVGSFTANTLFRNTNAMTTATGAGVQLWAGLRVAFSTTAPTYSALADDYSEGYLETFSSAGTFASTNTYTATIPTTASFLGALGPDLRVTLD